METQKLEIWKELRKKVVMGVSLSEGEQFMYEAGCAELNATERVDGNVEELRQKRQRTQELKTEYARLQIQYQIMTTRN